MIRNEQKTENSKTEKNIFKLSLKTFVIISVTLILAIVIVAIFIIENNKTKEDNKSVEEFERASAAELLEKSKTDTNTLEKENNKNSNSVEKKEFIPDKEETKIATTVEEYIKQIYPLTSMRVKTFPEFDSIQFADKEWIWSVAMDNCERYKC